MQHKSIFLLGIFIGCSLIQSSLAAEEKSGDSYLIYKNNVVQFCQNGDMLDDTSFWQGWRGASFLRVTNPEYGKVGDKNIFNKYQSFLSSIKADTTSLEEGKNASFPSLKTASAVYQETMNSNFNCAINMMRIKANKRLLEATFKVPLDTELKSRVEWEITALKKQMEDSACREMPDAYTKTQELKTALLDASFYQTCTYQFYLLYLSQEAKNDSANVLKNSDSFEVKEKEVKSQSVEAIANQLGDILFNIQSEQTQTQQALKKTLSVVNGFEWAYQMHIILRFVYQDYVDVRDSMRKLLFPIGQFIYKASNAQAPMN